ncbi:DUF4435 domain-containing protein [Hafnia alvei]|uniref:DUF4435 domain-containing protein n=1 Tax=Hafnia alvei TaxID=569 RepID=UPI0024A9FEB0|nr:DUF4435 domain-containing protein [Hafnia alvei]
MSSGLTYSINALNVMTHFYSGNKVVFVEGDGDQRFWESVYEAFGIENITIKCVNGCNLIDEYIDKIGKGASGIYVARDRDYKYLFDNDIDVNNVMLTYGYSIENSYYTDVLIARAIKSISTKSTPKDSISLDRDIIIPNIKHLFSLVSFDYAAYDLQKQIRVMGDSSSRFLKERTGCEICRDKTNECLSNVRKMMAYNEIIPYKRSVARYVSEPMKCIRGHFLSSMVLNYIKKKVNDLNTAKITYDFKMLEALLSEGLTISLANKTHPHLGYYSKQVMILKNNA